MSKDSANREPGETFASFQWPQQEQILAALVLLLGSDTAYEKRVFAAQRLARTGGDILPLLLMTLHAHPEIVTPSWPWWPPQYEQIARLLIQLSQSAGLTLPDLLHATYLPQPPGPVLWTSVIEAAGQLPHLEYEHLLIEGLTAPWWMVRYAAATAIANRAGHLSLCPTTREALHQCQYHDPALPVRLVAACALLRCSDNSGLDALTTLLETPTSVEIRRAALFILATELPPQLASDQRVRLTTFLLRALADDDQEIALSAARALRHVAHTGILAQLDCLLDDTRTQTRLATLVALEELARRKATRYAIQQQQLPGHVASLLYESEAEIRRQACYTLAALGGEYAMATLGTLILNDLHPAHLDAIEALRLLPDLHRPSVLAHVARWLGHILAQPIEIARARALDTLSYLIWQDHTQQRRKLLHTVFRTLQQNGDLLQLLTSGSAWVRQRTLELLMLFDTQLVDLRPLLLEMLHHDIDGGVRASLAHLLGQTAAIWAIPDLILALLDCDEHVAETALSALASLPLADNALIRSALQEVAVYDLPLRKIQQRRHLAHIARTRLQRTEML